MNINLRLTRHEIAHMLADFAWGCDSVRIEKYADDSGDGYQTLAHYPDSYTQGLEGMAAGSLGGRLSKDGIVTTDDDWFLDRCPPGMIEKLWPEVQKLQGELDSIDDIELTVISMFIEQNGKIEIKVKQGDGDVGYFESSAPGVMDYFRPVWALPAL